MPDGFRQLVKIFGDPFSRPFFPYHHMFIWNWSRIHTHTEKLLRGWPWKSLFPDSFAFQMPFVNNNKRKGPANNGNRRKTHSNSISPTTLIMIECVCVCREHNNSNNRTSEIARTYYAAPIHRTRLLTLCGATHTQRLARLRRWRVVGTHLTPIRGAN